MNKQMNYNYRINTHYALGKARKAVRSWERSLAEQEAKNDREGITFCQASLAACRANLAEVQESVKNVQEWI